MNVPVLCNGVVVVPREDEDVSWALAKFAKEQHIAEALKAGKSRGSVS